MGFDRSGGYFSTKYEVNSIWEGIDKDLTRFAGTQVEWFRFSGTDSTQDDIYDMGVNRVYAAPFNIEVVTALRQEGRDQQRQEGFYTADRLQIVVSMRELQRREMFDIVENTDRYLKDRVRYDGVWFNPQSAQVAGTLQEYDTVAGITLIEVRDDEQVYDDYIAGL